MSDLILAAVLTPLDGSGVLIKLQNMDLPESMGPFVVGRLANFQ